MAKHINAFSTCPGGLFSEMCPRPYLGRIFQKPLQKFFSLDTTVVSNRNLLLHPASAELAEDMRHKPRWARCPFRYGALEGKK